MVCGDGPDPEYDVEGAGNKSQERNIVPRLRVVMQHPKKRCISNDAHNERDGSKECGIRKRVRSITIRGDGGGAFRILFIDPPPGEPAPKLWCCETDDRPKADNKKAEP